MRADRDAVRASLSHPEALEMFDGLVCIGDELKGHAATVSVAPRLRDVLDRRREAERIRSEMHDDVESAYERIADAWAESAAILEGTDAAKGKEARRNAAHDRYNGRKVQFMREIDSAAKGEAVEGFPDDGAEMAAHLLDDALGVAGARGDGK